MLKDTVPIEIQSFFDYNNNLILKEMGIVSEKDQDLNKSVLREPPYDFTLLNTKFRNMVNQFPSQHFLERWRKQFSTNSKVSKDNHKRKTNYYLIC